MKNRRFIIAIMMFYCIISLLALVALLPTAIDVFHNVMNSVSATSPELVLFVFFFLLLVFALSCIYVVLSIVSQKKEKDNSINDNLHRTITGDRAFLEQEISEINERLVATESRWKEMYHLVLDAQNKRLVSNNTIDPALFLKSYEADKITVNPNDVFVVMPFQSSLKKAFYRVVEICEMKNLHAKRSDSELYPSSDIMKAIVQSIVRSRIIIAMIDGRNPNVMYELGIAHALGKPTIVICKKNERVPFDVGGKYVIMYGNYKELETELLEAISRITSEAC